MEELPGNLVNPLSPWFEYLKASLLLVAHARHVLPLNSMFAPTDTNNG